MLAALLRFAALDAKPAHFDEGVNGWFLEKMENSVAYDYDPNNYHGPLHFYASFPFVSTLGHTESALRLPAALFSMGTVALLLGFSGSVGRLSALLSAIFFTVSPAATFYSRYGIHESSLTFFVCLLALSSIRLYLTGAPKWLVGVVLALTGAALTKETFFINMVTLPMAMLTVWFLYKSSGFLRGSGSLAPPSPRRWSWLFLGSLVMGAFVTIELSYSSWGTSDTLGWGELIRAYSVWSETGNKGAGHVKVAYDILGGAFNYYWVALIARYEWPFLLALLSALIYWKTVSATAHIAAVWAVGTIVAYSLIPYKTPWCILSMMPAMSLTVGAFLSVPFLSLKSSLISVCSALALVASPLPYSIYLNFRAFDDPKEPYVYVQTSREAWKFIKEIKSAASLDPRFFDLPGLVAIGSYYPIPWWLADFSNIEYTSDTAKIVSPNTRWALVTWKNLTEFLEKNGDRRWRHYRFKLRDAQEDVIAVLDPSVFPEKGSPVYPE